MTENLPSLARPQSVKLECSYEASSCGAVTHIDSKGFIYCAFHGRRRQMDRANARRLSRFETIRLKQGFKVAY